MKSYLFYILLKVVFLIFLFISSFISEIICIFAPAIKTIVGIAQLVRVSP